MENKLPKRADDCSCTSDGYSYILSIVVLVQIVPVITKYGIPLPTTDSTAESELSMMVVR